MLGKVAKTCLLITLLLCLIQLGLAREPRLKFQVKGLTDPLLQNVVARLKALEADESGVDENDIQQWYEQSPDNIKIALQPYGYFNPHIDSRLQQINATTWQAHYAVSKGPPNLHW